MKNFDACAMHFEWRMQAYDAKYQRKIEAWFWEAIGDFVKHIKKYRKLDAHIAKKYGNYANGGKDAFNKRIVHSTLERVKKNRYFQKYMSFEKALTLLSTLKMGGV